MFKIVSSVCAIAMAVSVPFAAPAVAMPMPEPVFDRQAVTPVQGPGFGEQRYGRGIERRGGGYYYRGYRGYRHYRPGYRRYGDYWFPPAAFIAGAIIGGALSGAYQEPRYRPRGNAHVEWCYARYRSYRAHDNTYQPYNGPRRQCRSPYG